MPLNQFLKGKEYQEVSLAVTRAEVLAFAEAIGESNPIFRDPDAAKAAGYAEQVVPPTFVIRMHLMANAQFVIDQELGLNFMMVVHGEQQYEWRRPILVGDFLRAVPRIADIYTKGLNEFLVAEAAIEDASGETVIIARSTYVVRGAAKG